MKAHFVAASAFLLAAITSSFAQAMTAAEVEAEIIGKTVCVETPRGEVCIRHNADGTSQSISGMPDQQGTWRMDGDKHCVTWKGAEERCTGFERTANGFATDNGSIVLK